jgi:hypothetical protein
VERETTGCDKDYAATGGEGYSIPGKRGEVLKDEIAHEIVSELRLIRDEARTGAFQFPRTGFLDGFTELRPSAKRDALLSDARLQSHVSAALRR